VLWALCYPLPFELSLMQGDRTTPMLGSPRTVLLPCEALMFLEASLHITEAPFFVDVKSSEETCHI
jgi:hypothetical protein